MSHPRIGSGKVFVRQSAELSWDGVLAADGRITGSVAYAPEQEQLGATTWWLKRQLPMRVPRGGSRSTFALSPLPEGATCSDLD